MKKYAFLLLLLFGCQRRRQLSDSPHPMADVDMGCDAARWDCESK